MVRPGYGLLAADESTGTIGLRFSESNIENVEANRKAYRELLFTTPNIEKFISGVILYEETLNQSDSKGKPFAQLLSEKGIIPGIKVDKGVVKLPGSQDETATTGLDGLADRCKAYYIKGCRFAKWRTVIKLGKDFPSDLSISETAHSLARYAIICQENGLVPIVEPECLADGDHTIEECAKGSERVFIAVMKALIENHVMLEGILLKPNMITSGLESKIKSSSEEVAKFTLRTLSRTVCPAIPGIVFLSGGQSEEEASVELNAINKYPGIPKPWSLSFSFGRALQATCIKTWGGKVENVEAAQKALLIRAESNGLATLGKYMGGTGSKESLAVKNYTY